MAEQNELITATISRERGRLRNFIHQRVPDPGDAEDILQDVLFELTLAYRLPEPIEQMGAWLFRVARNRIIDLFRKHKAEPLPTSEDDEISVDNLLPSLALAPDDAYASSQLMQAIHTALEALPAEQRAIFVAHELEGRSFKEISLESGVSVNTLLSRKRYAVMQLRSQLQEIHTTFGM